MNKKIFYVKKMNERPFYFNPNGEMDHLMDGKHKILIEIFNNLNGSSGVDLKTKQRWFFYYKDLYSLKNKLINILNR